MKILIVEDNSINAKILVVYLENAGYRTIVALSAREALERLESDSEIMLVISDIMMPEMDGLEFLRIIKSRSAWRDIPVIMCSALSDLETVKRAVKEGCKHYIIKPVAKQHLLGKVREVMEEGNRQVLKDKKQIMKNLGLDEGFYKEIARDFLSLVESTIPLVENFATEKSSTEISNRILKLRENASYLGAERLLDALGERLPEEITAGENENICDHGLLLRELNRVRDALDSL